MGKSAAKRIIFSAEMCFAGPPLKQLSVVFEKQNRRVQTDFGAIDLMESNLESK